MDWNELVKKAFEISQTAVENYGPDAWNTVLWITRIDALGPMIVYLSLLAVFLALYKRYWKKWAEWCDTCYDEQAANVVRYAAGTVVSAVFFIIGLYVFYTWSIIQVFWPELYLAKEALEKVLN